MTKDIKLGTGLTFAFFFLAIITAAITITGVVNLFRISDASNALYEKQTANLSVISQIGIDMNSLLSDAQYFYINADSADKLKEREAKINQTIESLNKNINDYDSTSMDADTRKLFDECKTQFTGSFQPLLQEIVGDAKSGGTTAAKQNLAKLDEAYALMHTNFQQCMQSRINTAKNSNEGTGSNTILILIIVGSFGTVLAVLLALIIPGSISGPVNEMAVAAEELSKGNLNPNISYVAKSETGQLAHSLKSAASTLRLYVNDISVNLSAMADGDMTCEITQEYVGDFAPIKQALLKISDGLNETLSKIHTSSEQVKSGADQVSSGAQSLSQGATEQASSIEELSASIMEVSQKIRENAGNVKDAIDYVAQAGAGVNQSDAQMQHMVVAMNEIATSSNEISKIIKVIDDIAFQTNILALNAAVEAARAGAAGKGFAVVADEVRNLASKSADAAKHTTALIEGSIKAVQGGKKIADETAQMLANVEVKAHMVETAIEKIDKASAEQATAIEQITQGVEQISAVVQTNSATAEESAAASEELTGQASLLNEQVGQFKLKDAVYASPSDLPSNENSAASKPRIVLNEQNDSKY